MLLKSTKHAQYALILYYILTVFVHKLIYFLNKYENILEPYVRSFKKKYIQIINLIFLKFSNTFNSEIIYWHTFLCITHTKSEYVF